MTTVHFAGLQESSPSDAIPSPASQLNFPSSVPSSNNDAASTTSTVTTEKRNKQSHQQHCIAEAKEKNCLAFPVAYWAASAMSPDILILTFGLDQIRGGTSQMTFH